MKFNLFNLINDNSLLDKIKLVLNIVIVALETKYF